MQDDHEKKEPKRKFPEGVAVIPGGRGGPCQPILTVFMGENDNHDGLLLRTFSF